MGMNNVFINHQLIIFMDEDLKRWICLPLVPVAAKETIVRVRVSVGTSVQVVGCPL